jgi:hypothetical protein
VTPTTPNDKPARRTVSAQEKAREALRIAEARHAKAKEREAKAKTGLFTATRDVEAANREVTAYRRLVDDLTPKTAPSTTTTAVTALTPPDVS